MIKMCAQKQYIRLLSLYLGLESFQLTFPPRISFFPLNLYVRLIQDYSFQTEQTLRMYPFFSWIEAIECPCGLKS